MQDENNHVDVRIFDIDKVSLYFYYLQLIIWLCHGHYNYIYIDMKNNFYYLP